MKEYLLYLLMLLIGAAIGWLLHSNTEGPVIKPKDGGGPGEEKPDGGGPGEEKK